MDTIPRPPPKDETPPTKPPRPSNTREQAEITLREAFPSIDASIVKAVLTASGGNVEPAFNALLGMSDPDSQREPEPPAKPPRPSQQPGQTSTKLSQMEADELYARQLAEHYDSSRTNQRRGSGGRFNEHLQGSRVGRPGASPNPDDVPWRSFVDGKPLQFGQLFEKPIQLIPMTDDLPEIRDNIRKGFQETQKTVNSWISAFKKNFDGEDEDDPQYRPAQPPRPGQQGAHYPASGGYPNRRSGDMRRSADMQRYDADPQLIGDDFSRLELRDGEAPPRTSGRPLANPNLFRSGANDPERRPSPGGNRKVSFQDGPPEEIQDMYSSSTTKPSTITTTSAPSSGGKASKWQPLSTVDPSPVADNDPFSLGDSDEEKDAKPISLKDDEVAASTGTSTAEEAGKKATTEEDERVKKATDEAIKESIASETK